MRLNKDISYNCAIYIRYICKLFGINIYYHSKYGFKMFLGKTLEELHTDNTRVISVSTEDLLLGVDGLYDEYTHIGIPVNNSPHFGLMYACQYNDFSNCDYINLEECGALDSRDQLRRSIEKHKICFDKSRSEIESGLYKPIIYYTVGSKKYIHDGKHRAALCSLLNLNVNALEVAPSYVNSHYITALKKDMNISPGRYIKHSSIVNSITSNENA